MAPRFRKSIKLAPGIRMNLSGSGVSWSLGPRGATMGIGKRGTFLNTGIPGTGLYSRQALSQGGSSSLRTRSAPTVSVSIAVSVSDDGTVTFRDSNGSPVPEAVIEAAKKQKGDVIKTAIQEICDDINAQVEALEQLHFYTPAPTNPPSYLPQPFETPRPVEPTPKNPGFCAKFFKSQVAKIEQNNAQARAAFESALRSWETGKATHDQLERSRQRLFSDVVSGNADAMESFFGEVLSDIVWPRETFVSFEVGDGGKSLAFDVDLPEIEDMPTKTASVPQRGFKLTVKEMGSTHVQKLYARHIHSIGFRLLGEAFGMLPTVQIVTLSGYSQRKSRVTGHEEDEYLFSVIVYREQWEQINFNNLESIDVVEAFTRFNIRREMTKTGLFKAVEPF